MSEENPPDVPSPINLQDMADAREWARTAMKRPFREEFFEAFTQELKKVYRPGLRILELGSGPGFLAQYILSRMKNLHYVMLDFSAPMHEFAAERLKGITDSDISYLERSFKGEGWPDGIGQFDVVITNQAVHELRHKRYAPALFKQVSGLIRPDGILLFCDHYCGSDGMSNDQLYMSRDEQRQALKFAGFSTTEIMVKGGRALHKAAWSKIMVRGYIVVPDNDLVEITSALLEHINLTRQEPGCLRFEVTPNPTNKNTFTVYEEFVDRSAFEAHQLRVSQSKWGRHHEERRATLQDYGGE